MSHAALVTRSENNPRIADDLLLRHQDEVAFKIAADCGSYDMATRERSQVKLPPFLIVINIVRECYRDRTWCRKIERKRS
jgi:hypothetical protein